MIAMTRKTKTLEEQIWDAKLKLYELSEDYATQLYLEAIEADYTGPTYEYSIDKANYTIPGEMYDVDAWLRAVIKHMATRRRGQGGYITNARVVSIPENLTEEQIEIWIDYETKRLRKLVKPRKKSK